MADFPTVTISSPEDDSETAASPIALEGMVSAGTFDVDRVEARSASPVWVTMTPGEGNAWSGSLGLIQGANVVRVRGVDVNGNTGVASTITVTMTGATHVGNHHGFYVGTGGNSSKFWSGAGW